MKKCKNESLSDITVIITIKIAINETQALAVKLIYEFYAYGESMGGIPGRLEVCNISSPYNNPIWGRHAISNFYNINTGLKALLNFI